MAAPTREHSAQDTRQRLMDVAVRLFSQRSFAGTSLQMIADELGVTKAAVYHHFHTREELLIAIIEPVRTQMRATVEEAEALRGTHARAERMLAAFIDITVRNRALIAVLAVDPGVIDMLRAHFEINDMIERQLKLLADVQPGPAGVISAGLVLAGIAAATGPNRMVDYDDETLRRHLMEAGRRALGLRAPRRPAA
jgi:AcrR family transcriptional regulator